MTTPQMIYPTTEEAAIALAHWVDECRIQPPLTARPWNRYASENSEWYLVPNTDWPAYRYSKLILQPTKQGTMRAAFYVEKGVDSKQISSYSHKQFVMDDQWAWHRLLAAFAHGRLDAPCRVVAERSGAPVRVWVDGGMHQDEAYDRAAERDRWTYLSYRWSDGALVCQEESSTLPDPCFAPLTSCASLAELAQALPKIQDIDWKWINLYLGVECGLTPKIAQGSSGTPWDAGKLWRCCFDPWRDWLC